MASPAGAQPAAATSRAPEGPSSSSVHGRHVSDPIRSDPRSMSLFLTAVLFRFFVFPIQNLIAGADCGSDPKRMERVSPDASIRHSKQLQTRFRSDQISMPIFCYWSRSECFLFSDCDFDLDFGRRLRLRSEMPGTGLPGHFHPIPKTIAGLFPIRPDFAAPPRAS